MDTEASRALVLEYYRAFGKGDQAALAVILSDDVEWLPPKSAPLTGGPFRGREKIQAAMLEAGARFFRMDSAKTDTLKIVAEGDTVVVRQRMSCTAANGRPYQNEYVWLFTCKDGRITRMEEHTDSLYFQRVVIDP